MGTEVEETKMDTAINEPPNEGNVNENEDNNNECPGECEEQQVVKEEALRPLLKKNQLPFGIKIIIKETPNCCYRCTFCDFNIMEEITLLEHVRENGHLQKLHFRKSRAVGIPQESQVMKYLNRLSGPIVGLNYVVEVQMPRITPSFQCNLCDVACGISAILKHIVSNQHQFRYLKSVDEFALSELRSKFLKRADMNREIAKYCEKLQRERGSGKVEVKYVSNPTPRTSALKGLNLTKNTSVKSPDAPRTSRGHVEASTRSTSVKSPDGKRSSDGRQSTSKRQASGDESSPRIDNSASSTSQDFARHNQSQSSAEQSQGHNQKAGGQSVEFAAQQVAEHVIKNDDEAKMLTDLVNVVTENLIQYKLSNLPSSVRQLLFKKMNTEGKSMESIMGLSGSADLSALDKLQSMNSNRHNLSDTAQRNWGNDSPQHQHSKIPSLLSRDDFYGERSGSQMDFSRSGHNRNSPYGRQSGSKMRKF